MKKGLRRENYAAIWLMQYIVIEGIVSMRLNQQQLD